MTTFDSDSYFSESQKQMIPVATMPLPYARNVLNKLLRDYEDEFRGSPLHSALLKRLIPDTSELKRLLAQHGEASMFLLADHEDKAVRSIFYRIGKRLGVKVHTHKNGSFMEATCAPVPVEVRIRKVSVE